MKKITLLTKVITLATVLVFLLSFGSFAASFKPPKNISVITYELGSSGYMSYGFIGEYMIKTYGTKIRAIPAGNDTARMIALRSKVVQFAGQGLDAHYAMDGITPRYSSSDWGPRPGLRIAWLAKHPGQCFVVRGNSDIKEIKDLKGKKLAYIPGSALNDLAEGHLAYAGLSWKDVKKVNVPGYVPSVKAIIDGTVDTAVVMVTSGVVRELAASPYGLRFLPETDEKGIARIRAKVSDLVPTKATVGATLSEKHPAYCMTYPYPATVCYDTLDDNIAYFMTKCINEGYKSMSKGSALIKNYWTLDDFLYLYEQYDYAILHNGSAKYIKEIGRWKPEYDKYQKERSEHYQKLRVFFDKVVDLAIEKKIKSKAFPDFWLKERANFLKK